ncbi:unnamed protein product [Moneuplotes crassus]|uniref:Uncharacterized protein n=1 Tax=Euplotes crassus TaxID=5936 RepID=A0AAD1XGU4_EUPCR|nr:unnamed protein product [Moneuplotes crassus]
MSLQSTINNPKIASKFINVSFNNQISLFNQDLSPIRLTKPNKKKAKSNDIPTRPLEPKKNKKKLYIEKYKGVNPIKYSHLAFRDFNSIVNKKLLKLLGVDYNAAKALPETLENDQYGISPSKIQHHNSESPVKRRVNSIRSSRRMLSKIKHMKSNSINNSLYSTGSDSETFSSFKNSDMPSFRYSSEINQKRSKKRMTFTRFFAGDKGESPKITLRCNKYK